VNWIGGDRDYKNFEPQLAMGSVALLGIWPSWASTYNTTMEQVIGDIRRINPNTQVFLYIINQGMPDSWRTNPDVSVLVDKVDAMHWWLYKMGTDGETETDTPGYTTVNNTLFTPPDENGDNWIEWYAKWAVRTYATSTQSLDGFFLDNVFWTPRAEGDWNRDGTGPDKLDDPIISPLLGTWQREGLRHHFEVMRQLMPGKLQIGNIADWGKPEAVITEFDQQLNGGLIEGIIGYSWSVETSGTWSDMMAWYRKTMAAIAAPKLVLFHQVGNPTDYQAFRYGLASCLMDDGYYVFNSETGGYGDAPDFDEYHENLGSATSGPTMDPWKNGVYRRDFENGIALVNPKGNGQQTVYFDNEVFRKIGGSQDPNVNDGTTVDHVTLQDRDGVILLRQ